MASPGVSWVPVGTLKSACWPGSSTRSTGARSSSLSVRYAHRVVAPVLCTDPVAPVSQFAASDTSTADWGGSDVGVVAGFVVDVVLVASPVSVLVSTGGAASSAASGSLLGASVVSGAVSGSPATSRTVGSSSLPKPAATSTVTMPMAAQVLYRTRRLARVAAQQAAATGNRSAHHAMRAGICQVP